MPLYDVQHSYPLNTNQKQQLAEAITHLHSTTFLTPSLYVHVTFHSVDATEPNYYLAGKPCSDSTNRIVAMVRTSDQRKPEHWDKLAAQIEEKWYDVVSGETIEDGKDEGKRKAEVDDSDRKHKAKKLLLVTFYAMVAVRENGLVVPPAGGEAAWYKEYKSEFQKRADEGEEEYKDLIEEVETREDLRKAYLG